MEKSVQELNQDELEELRGNYSRTTTKYGFRCFRWYYKSDDIPLFTLWGLPHNDDFSVTFK
jgi:hypothetical protein